MFFYVFYVRSFPLSPMQKYEGNGSTAYSTQERDRLGNAPYQRSRRTCSRQREGARALVKLAGWVVLRLLLTCGAEARRASCG